MLLMLEVLHGLRMREYPNSQGLRYRGSCRIFSIKPGTSFPNPQTLILNLKPKVRPYSCQLNFSRRHCPGRRYNTTLWQDGPCFPLLFGLGRGKSHEKADGTCNEHLVYKSISIFGFHTCRWIVKPEGMAEKMFT